MADTKAPAHAAIAGVGEGRGRVENRGVSQCRCEGRRVRSGTTMKNSIQVDSQTSINLRDRLDDWKGSSAIRKRRENCLLSLLTSSTLDAQLLFPQSQCSLNLRRLRAGRHTICE